MKVGDSIKCVKSFIDCKTYIKYTKGEICKITYIHINRYDIKLMICNNKQEKIYFYIITDLENLKKRNIDTYYLEIKEFLFYDYFKDMKKHRTDIIKKMLEN